MEFFSPFSLIARAIDGTRLRGQKEDTIQRLLCYKEPGTRDSGDGELFT